jgi:acyl-CoA synthetase (AMP-forming)/AMP-acid ligase II
MLSAKALGINAEDRLLLTAPLFHVASLDDLLVGALTAGGTVFMLRSFDPAQCLESIQNERLTMAFFVPLMFQLIIGPAASGEYDLCSLRNWGSAAAPMPLELRRQILTGFPDINLYEAFGQTENPMITVMTSHNTADRPESCGRPVSHTLIRILDEGGRQVPAGAVGEIAVNGPATMASYYRNPEATDLAIRDGWLLTGDMGRLDEEGYLYIVDRKKDMIVTGGENVYAAEVENILIRHPKVQEVAVVGLKDPVWGERVTAAVVPVQGQAVTEEEIIEFAKKDLASYKCPKEVKFVECLPKSTLMKVLKRQLKEILMAKGN